ncbi:hypothetical protein [Sporosarcina sp. E16_8]|uniref:hypothetical protein n=1 Tax=Sporosarcina sp. E16_8 TaxID=2789295 RepID=UPI001A92182B|nr:hypothetical protein [Sporosarcina sp. E16_8]MBO0587710.1 hypothetical protein [Sporosarcina sp. E16_8]
MTRTTNFKEMNQLLFGKFYALMESYPRIFDREPKWIVLDDEEKQICNRSYVIDKLLLENGVESCLIEKEDDLYFAIVGDQGSEEAQAEFFHAVDVSKGFFLRIISDLDSKPTITTLYELEETLLFYSKETPGYIGHDVETVMSYFPKIKLFHLDKQFSFSEAPLTNLTGYFVCEYSRNREVALNVENLETYKQLFIENYETLNYTILLRSLLNPYRKDVFMDIYRCIEYLYRAIGIKELQKSMNTTLGIGETYNFITSNLQYKFTESYCVGLIFNKLSDEVKEKIRAIVPDIVEGKEGEWFYGLRNSLVHGKRKEHEIKLSNSQWELLIGASLEILRTINVYANENNLSADFVNSIQKK